jgi:orotidine-5'-phosphate decarboxylase
MTGNPLAQSSPIIVALDYPTADAALAMASNLDPEKCRVKVGKELFTRCGPKILDGLHKQGFDVFLDLKFHDIPNTTANAVAVAADLGVWMVNVHASGGRRMMDACVEKLSTFKQKPFLIGVTVLTSMQSEDLAELGLAVSPLEQVTKLASLTKACGLDGVVCSSHEVASLKRQLGHEFKLVTPGIRPSFSVKGDQRRVMTPREAIEAGSDYLVIGRPITQAEDPLQALSLITQELS